MVDKLNVMTTHQPTVASTQWYTTNIMHGVRRERHTQTHTHRHRHRHADTESDSWGRSPLGPSLASRWWMATRSSERHSSSFDSQTSTWSRLWVAPRDTNNDARLLLATYTQTHHTHTVTAITTGWH